MMGLPGQQKRCATRGGFAFCRALDGQTAEVGEALAQTVQCRQAATDNNGACVSAADAFHLAQIGVQQKHDAFNDGEHFFPWFIA